MISYIATFAAGVLVGALIGLNNTRHVSKLRAELEELLQRFKDRAE